MFEFMRRAQIWPRSASVPCPGSVTNYGWHRGLARLLVVVVLLLSVVGCARLPFSLPWQRKTPTPGPTDSVTSSVMTEVPGEQPGITPTDVLPREQGAGMPKGPYPPVVVDFFPRPGEEVPPVDMAITIQFDQPMDQASVSSALRVKPLAAQRAERGSSGAVEGDLSWDGPDTLHFRPKALAVNTRYQVSLGPEARSREGLSLSTALDFAFTTIGALHVTRVSPEDGAVDLRLDIPVLIAFNRPVVPLNCAGQEAGKSPACPELPITLAPSTIGKGMWVNTSLYRYESALGGWMAGETYEVRLGTDFPTLQGSAPYEDGALSEPVVWTFSTALPFIQEINPPKGAQNVRLERGIRVVFNTPMDLENTAAAFSLVDENGETVPGSITWEDHGSTLVFTPTHQLALGTRYMAQVADRARALTSAPLQNPSQWSFTTVPPPTLLNTSPPGAAENVSPQDPVRITLGGVIDERSLEKHVMVTPTEQSVRTYWNETSGRLTLSWDKEARTEYCVSVHAGIKDVYGNTMGGGGQESDVVSEFCFETGDFQPFFAPAATLETFTLDAAESARFYFLNRNVGRVSFLLSRIEGSIPAFLHSTEGAQYVTFREWQESFAGEPNKVNVMPVDLVRRGGPLPTGVYNLSWEGPTATWWRQVVKIAVVDLHVMLKLADEEALVWVTDLRSAEPMTRTEVHLLDKAGILIAAGTTDSEGLARIPISPRENLWDGVVAMVGEPGAPGFGIASTRWNAGISPWDFDIPIAYDPVMPYHIYMHTDRPIYRPGQQVNFRGIVRMDKDARYLLPVVKDVGVSVRDALGRVVYSTTLSLSQMGTFDGRYLLSEDAPIGEYVIETSVIGEETVEQFYFSVAAYRKPEFALTLTAAQDDLLDGDRLRALVEANYYFGGPVANARLTWVIRSSPYHGMVYDRLFAHDLDASASWYGAGRNIAEGEARTDAQGQFLLEIPAELKRSDASGKVDVPDGAKSSARWMIEVTLTDVSGFTVSARDHVRVHAARFYLRARPHQWAAMPGEAVEVDVTALDWDALPVGGQDVTVQLVQRAWYRVFAEQAYAGPTWAYTDTLVGAPIGVETGAQGEAVATVTPPDSGAYVIVAAAEDEEGNPVRAESSLWVGGPGVPQWRMPEGKIEPVADLATYHVGDTAEILVPTAFTGTYQVLMTVERGGILGVQKFTFDEPNPMVSLPIKETYLPNVYVSFIVIRGVDEAYPAPEVRVGMVTLNVSPELQALRVILTPEQDSSASGPGSYGPGDTVNLTVRTLDAAGEPVQAEVGLAVVDKAVLALAGEEEGVPIMESFYGGRPLRVVMGDSLLMLFNRIASDVEILEKDAERLAAMMAAGGIGGGGGMAAPTEVRQEFPDTAFWEAHVGTGPSGETQVSFKLPDSLTTWVVDARAVTADTQVGQATTELMVSKPLLVRPVTPRFFVAGDRVEIATVVHNNTDEELDVTVQLDVAGAALEGGNASQTVSIAAAGMTRVTWPIVVAEASQAVCLTFVASGGGYQDASGPTVGLERVGDLDTFSGCETGTLPVYRYEAPDVVGTSGVLGDAGQRVEAVWLPENAGEASRVTARIDPSLGSVVIDALEAASANLEVPASMSTDMLVNRFLPNVYTYRALQSLALEQEALEERLQVLVTDALDRLYARQNDVGGWGWWRREDTSMYLTAYVTLGMLEAQRAGFTVREDNLRRALDYLAAALSQSLNSGARASSQPFTLFVLSEADYYWSDQVATVLYNDRSRLSVTGRAYLVLALGKVAVSDPRVVTLLEGLNADVEVTATGAHWVDADRRYWATDILATTAVLEVLARFDSQNPLLAQGVRWLIAAREGRGWPTAYETTWSLIALTDYMLAMDVSSPDYTWSLAFNGVPLADGESAVEGGTFEFLNADSEADSARDPGDQGVLQAGVNVLEIARTAGGGELYYTAHAALALPADEVTLESRGIVVQREYCAVEENRPLKDRGLDQAREALSPCESVSQVNAGDLVEVRLTLVLPRNRYFLTLEDVYPAGMEPVDPSLRTESQGLPEPETHAGGNGMTWWRDPFEHRVLRDERAVFYTREIPAGTYQVTYLLRAVIPGTYRVLPATAFETYFPEVWGRSAGALFQVVP